MINTDSLIQLIRTAKYISSEEKKLILEKINNSEDEKFEAELQEMIEQGVEKEIKGINQEINKSKEDIKKGQEETENIDRKLQPIIKEKVVEYLENLKQVKDEFKNNVNFIQGNYEKEIEKEVVKNRDEKDADAIRQKLGLK